MIKLKNISKKYGEVDVLNNFNLDVGAGEFIAITGQSGSGKTTLINIMGMIIAPDSGEVIITDIVNPKGKKLRNIRKKNISYLFQNYFLLENLTVKRNFKIAITKKRYNESLAIKVLDDVNLNCEILNKKVCQLSGGEQQRVALARALLNDFDVLFADEPTGNLDDENKNIVLSLLIKLRDSGKSIVCATHDDHLAKSADRVISL